MEKTEMTDLKIVPQECTLYMTDRCNFKCVCCLRTVLGVKQFKDMKLEMVKRLLARYPSVKGFCIAGLGEPTLCPEFVEILDYISANGKYIGLITNGTNVERIMALKSEPYSISISLYGYDSQTYQRHTGIPGMFDKVIRNYRTFKARFQNVGFSYIVNTANYLDLEKILRLTDELKPDFLNLHNHLAYDCMEENVKKIITVRDTAVIEHINRVSEGRSYVRKPIYLDKESDLFLCNSYNSVINLDGDGNIGGCQRQFQPDVSYGNILTDADAYNTPAMLAFRAKARSYAYPHDECRFCFGKTGSVKNVLLEKDRVIAEGQTKLAQKDAVIAEKERLIAEKDAQPAEKDRIIAADKALLAEKERQIADDRLLLAQKDEAVAEINARLAQKNGIIAEKESVIASKDAEINLLREKEAYLNAVLNSPAWKLRGIIYGGLNFFFPAGSRRRRCIDRCLMAVFKGGK